MSEMFDLTGKTALVTGASRGLGQAMALGLAKAGAKVAGTSRRLSALEETQDRITDAGGSFQAMRLDVSNADELVGTISTHQDKAGGFDILINNAGYEEVAPSTDVDEALWDRIVETNLKGAFFCAQTVAKAMQKKGRGSIINICSLTSYVGVPTAVPYTSSKSGLLGMTRALSAEWAAQNIRVNAIAPGYFRTDLTDSFYQNDDWQRAMLDKIPMRTFGDANDLQGAVVFLASDASRYITGQCLAVDGGYLASI